MKQEILTNLMTQQSCDDELMTEPLQMLDE